jgi:hypothetical protein
MITVSATFEQHVISVRRLMNFDRDVLQFTVDALRDLKETLTKHHKLGNPRLTAENTLRAIENIRANNSLRPQYETIFNQALVLLVSYFSSSVHDVFRRGAKLAIERVPDSPLLKEELRLTVAALHSATGDLKESLPDLLIQSKDISFQDMQSIGRTFRTYLQIDIQKDEIANDIILGQACRHVIVHTRGVVDEKLLRQVSGAKPRHVKRDLRLGDTVQFVPEEVEQVAEAMRAYIGDLSSKVASHVGAEI